MRKIRPLPEPWVRLVEQFGSMDALARRFRVTPRTIYNWASGKTKMNGLAKLLFYELTVKPNKK